MILEIQIGNKEDFVYFFANKFLLYFIGRGKPLTFSLGWGSGENNKVKHDLEICPSLPYIMFCTVRCSYKVFLFFSHQINK